MNRLINSLRPVARKALRTNGSTFKIFSTPETFTTEIFVERVVGVVKHLTKLMLPKLQRNHISQMIWDLIPWISWRYKWHWKLNSLLKFQTKRQIILFPVDKLLLIHHIHKLSKQYIFK